MTLPSRGTVAQLKCYGRLKENDAHSLVVCEFVVYKIAYPLLAYKTTYNSLVVCGLNCGTEEGASGPSRNLLYFKEIQ